MYVFWTIAVVMLQYWWTPYIFPQQLIPLSILSSCLGRIGMFSHKNMPTCWGTFLCHLPWTLLSPTIHTWKYLTSTLYCPECYDTSMDQDFLTWSILPIPFSLDPWLSLIIVLAWTTIAPPLLLLLIVGPCSLILSLDLPLSPFMDTSTSRRACYSIDRPPPFSLSTPFPQSHLS